MQAHNEYRAIHDAPAMTLNSQMNEEAAEWAEHWASKGSLEIEHSPHNKRNGDGENIYLSCGIPVSGQSVTTEW